MPSRKAKDLALSWYMEQAEREIWADEVSFNFPILLHYKWPGTSLQRSLIIHPSFYIVHLNLAEHAKTLLLIFLFANVFQQRCTASSHLRITQAKAGLGLLDAGALSMFLECRIY